MKVLTVTRHCCDTSFPAGGIELPTLPAAISTSISQCTFSASLPTTRGSRGLGYKAIHPEQVKPHGRDA
jgi:hypothetical protein